MNMGYEDDELKPYQEAQPDLNDQKRIGKTGTVQQQQQNNHSFIQVKIFFGSRFDLSSCNVIQLFDLLIDVLSFESFFILLQ